MKFCVLLVILFLVGCAAEAEENLSMEVYVFGIEDADAILITTENYTVMIDTGTHQQRRYIVERLGEKNISAIDYLIITHFDRDHVGGAHAVIDYFHVENIIMPNYGHASRAVERFEAAKERAGIEAYVLTEAISLELDGAVFKIYPADLPFHFFGREEDEYGDEPTEIPRGDDFSIVVTVAHGENNFIFTGDALAARLTEILEITEIVDTDFDFLKVPHHGRHNRASVEFFNAINPRYAVSTCCFRRPTDARVIAALENLGAEIFFSKFGGVRVYSDGSDIFVVQAK